MIFDCDFENEVFKSENLPEIDVNFENVEEPLLEDLSSLIFSKADFRTFISLRAAS